jgi:CPA2 family monovalent cation:H+ antiporter-2
MPEHATHGLVEALFLLAAAVVAVPIARALRTSSVIAYLVVGVVLGPGVLGLVGESDSIELLAELGVVFLLFDIGLELSFERLRAMRREVFGLGSLQIVATGAALTGILLALGASGEAALVVGGALALSSTAFVMRLLADRGEAGTRHGRLSLSVLLMQDLAIVPLLALTIALGERNTSLAGALGLAALKTVLGIGATIAVGRLVLRPVFRFVASARDQEVSTAATLLVAIGTGYLLSLLGVSMALGAFLAGLMLSGTEYRHQVEADVRPFRGLLFGLFFVSVGLAIDPALLAPRLLELLAATLVLMTAKALVLFAAARVFAVANAPAARVALLLSQGSEFAFVLVGMAFGLGLVHQELANFAIATVVLSMLLTPLAAFLGERIARRFEPVVVAPDETERVAAHGAHLSGHVVLAGFGRVGRTVARVLVEADRPFVAIEREMAVVSQFRARDLPVFVGDASRLDVLRAAGVERASAAVITIDDHAAASHTVAALHEVAPDLLVFVRARDLVHQGELERAGATAVVPETLEGSLQLGAVTLARTGASIDQVAAVLGSLREHGYGACGDLHLTARKKERAPAAS